MQYNAIEVTIEVDDRFASEVDTDEVIQLVRYVLQAEGVPIPSDVSIWITDEAELQALNRTYRGVDRSTDVLSFGEDTSTPFVNAPGQPRHLGDLAVSYPHVVRQAEEYGHSRKRELSYLVTHGLLHLLGYDHERPEDAAIMRRREEALLGDLHITREDTHGT
jgi:probable rRNA maturation factor